MELASCTHIPPNIFSPLQDNVLNLEFGQCPAHGKTGLASPNHHRRHHNHPLLDSQ